MGNKTKKLVGGLLVAAVLLIFSYSLAPVQNIAGSLRQLFVGEGSLDPDHCYEVAVAERRGLVMEDKDACEAQFPSIWMGVFGPPAEEICARYKNLRASDLRDTLKEKVRACQVAYPEMGL